MSDIWTLVEGVGESTGCGGRENEPKREERKRFEARLFEWEYFEGGCLCKLSLLDDLQSFNWGIVNCPILL
jgi:hypothetical protein